MKIIIFGIGKVSKKILNYIIKPDIELLFICDNNKSLWNTTVLNYKIMPPSAINNVYFDRIIIAICNGWALNEIAEQLDKMGVPKSKVVYSYDPVAFRYCETALDEFFYIPKVEYDIPFKKNTFTPRPECKGETSKARDRREREGFFKKFCQGDGLDIGCGGDPVVPGVSGWDILNGDAQYLRGIEDETFDFVYSSHCLEHMHDVRVALCNWFRVVRPGGFLIICVPDRDLFEKKKTLPSRWNGDHKHFFLLGKAEEPDTLDILEEIEKSIVNYIIIYAKECKEGHTITEPLKQSDGEYQIEIVVQKTV